MKKLLLIIMILSILPIYPMRVDAVISHLDAFKVGDKVAVMREAIPESPLVEITNPNGSEWFVLRDSPAGEQFVWLIFNGTVRSRGPEDRIRSEMEYDFHRPGSGSEDHRATGVLREADIWLSSLAPLSAVWKIEDIRLLNQADLDAAGVSNGQIPWSKRWLAPNIFPDLAPPLNKPFNYWTMICQNDRCETPVGETFTASPVNMMVMTHNPAGVNSDTVPVATLQPLNISQIECLVDPDDNNCIRSVKPVILIDKKYIDCRLDECPADCPMGTVRNAPHTDHCPEFCLVDPVPTNQVVLPLQIVGLGLFAGGIYILMSKRNAFQKI